MLRIYDDQQMFSGRNGSILYFREWLAANGVRNALYVTGKNSFRVSGAAAFLGEALGREPVPRFPVPHSNPDCADLYGGLKAFADMRPDGIVAVGGGSVMDMAKMINFFAATGQDPLEYLRGTAGPTRDQALLPLLAIPTTAGSGSEATHFAVVYHDGVKASVADPRMIPDAVILNSVLTENMSAYLTACTGIDALAQGMEAYWAVGSTSESKNYAKEALRRAWSHLDMAVKRPDAESRCMMQEAAYFSGRAINISKTTAAHAFSYALTSHFDLPHGHAVAMFLPSVLAFNADVSAVTVSDPRGQDYARDTMRDLCGLLGESSPETAVAALACLIRNIGLTGDWAREKGLQRQDIADAVLKGVDADRLGNNPRRFGEEDIRSLLGRLPL